MNLIAFKKYKKQVAQILLSPSDIKNKKSSKNAMATLENILNFKQQNPIQDAIQPFSENFDAGLVWGPIFGRIIYGGFRWRIKSK